jgi:hypothetical protein
MNEKEAAKFYEERRGDTSLWAETPSKANIRRGGSVVFSLRFSRQELELLRQRAEVEGATVSELIRRAAMREATGEVLPIVTVTRPVDEPGVRWEVVVLDLGAATFRALSVESGFEVAVTPVAVTPGSSAGDMPSGTLAPQNSVIWN